MAAKRGNKTAVKSGVSSEVKLGPVREEHARSLKVRYPKLDDIRRAILADRMARIELASAWLDAQNGVIRSADGDVFNVVPHLDKWQGRVEKMLADLEAERRGSKPATDLATQMAALADAETDNG